MTRKISIDPITRLEGHGKIEIFLDDDGAVEDTFFQIPELRGFERFVVGRPIEELPRIVTRICGVCPASHHMASAKAVDGCFGGQVAPLAHKLRDMYYQAHFIHSHIAHFYALAAPDFVLGPDADPATRNILGVVHKVGLEIGGAVIARARHGAGDPAHHRRPQHPGHLVPAGRRRQGAQEGGARADQALGRQALRLRAVLAAALPATSCSPTRPTSTSSSTGPTRSTCTTWASSTRTTRPTSTTARCASSTSTARRSASTRPTSTPTTSPSTSRSGRTSSSPTSSSAAGRASTRASTRACTAPPRWRASTSPTAWRRRRAQEAFEEMFATLGGHPSRALLANHWARLVEMVQNAETLQACTATTRRSPATSSA